MQRFVVGWRHLELEMADEGCEGHIQRFEGKVESIQVKLVFSVWAVVEVEWSKCSTSVQTIRVRIPLKSTVFVL